jgi:hypothetical protein
MTNVKKIPGFVIRELDGHVVHADYMKQKKCVRAWDAKGEIAAAKSRRQVLERLYLHAILAVLRTTGQRVVHSGRFEHVAKVAWH